MIVTEQKIAAVCEVRGISREAFQDSIAEDLGGGMYRLTDSAVASMMSPPSAGQPSLLARAGNFATAAARHVAAGAPRCTDEQIAERFAICVGCEHYDGSECRKCGCPVVRKRQWISKLSWAGESCPVGKWGPIPPSPTAPPPVDPES